MRRRAREERRKKREAEVGPSGKKFEATEVQDAQRFTEQKGGLKGTKCFERKNNFTLRAPSVAASDQKHLNSFVF